MFLFVSTGVTMTTQPFVKKEPPEGDTMSTTDPINSTGMYIVYG